MNKNKFVITSLISILIIGLVTLNVSSMSKVEKSPVGKYLSALKMMENNYYLVGKAVIEDSCTNKNKEELINEIKFYLSSISELKNSMNNYLLTIKGDKIEYRNTEALLLIADYFRIGLEELLIILDSENEAIDYNSLESYFYSKVLAKQSINFVESQLNTNIK